MEYIVLLTYKLDYCGCNHVYTGLFLKVLLSSCDFMASIIDVLYTISSQLESACGYLYMDVECLEMGPCTTRNLSCMSIHSDMFWKSISGQWIS